MATAQRIPATVVRGHGVASGRAQDARFPEGTLRLQLPVFAALGLDLSSYFPGTINLSIDPARFVVVAPRVTFTSVTWHPDCPPETFSFCDCRLAAPPGAPALDGLVYYPHPDTKPEHFQAPGVLEILAPKIDGLAYGTRADLFVDPTQILIEQIRT